LGQEVDCRIDFLAEQAGLGPSYPYNDCLTSKLNETNETV